MRRWEFNFQAWFWIWIHSLHCAVCMGFSVLIFLVDLWCGAGCVSFIGHCVVVSFVFPSIFLCGVYSVCGGGNSQARFWNLIVSIHCAVGMGFSVLIFRIVLRCGAGGVSFVGHFVVPSVVFPSMFLRGGVVSAVVEFPSTVLDFDRFSQLCSRYGVFCVDF